MVIEQHVLPHCGVQLLIVHLYKALCTALGLRVHSLLVLGLFVHHIYTQTIGIDGSNF